AGAYGVSAMSPVLEGLHPRLENLVTRQHTEQHFTHANLADVPHTQMSDFLEAIEQQHPRNVYSAESEDLLWSKICLERADETWLVVDANNAVAQVEQALETFKPLFSWQRQRKNLILIHPDQNRIRNTEQWLRAIQPNRLCHLHIDSPRAARRLNRALSDQTVGLVLGGGGARGFAQIGILRAFEEANIEVDMIGGTSIGSIIGGWIAQELDSQQITEAVERFFVTVNPLGDYTLPMISLSKSQRLDTLLEQAFGDQLIEDLPIPYFCISSDMSMAEERHHFQGCLRRAIRASISIPGVIAPVIEDGHYLVDGGLFNNLPCDLMRQQNTGPIIAIDVSPDDEYLTQLQSIPSPWELVANKLLNRYQPKVPSILETLLRSSTLVSTNRRRANRDIVDFYIQPDIKDIGMLEFKQARKIIEAGYVAGQKALEEGVASIRKMRPTF
ncbi:MAG: patatin-like phospholipase family protein, partial [Pseudomonadales bacterium]|nr:patatin-like phospholipase family protein [Pseudomonadales bacterium]